MLYTCLLYFSLQLDSCILVEVFYKEVPFNLMSLVSSEMQKVCETCNWNNYAFEMQNLKSMYHNFGKDYVVEKLLLCS